MRKSGADFDACCVIKIRESPSDGKSAVLLGDIFKDFADGELSTRALYSTENRDIWFGGKACLWELSRPFSLGGKYVDLQSAWSVQRRINVVRLKSRFVTSPEEVNESELIFLSKNLDALRSKSAGYAWMRYIFLPWVEKIAPVTLKGYCYAVGLLRRHSVL